MFSACIGGCYSPSDYRPGDKQFPRINPLPKKVFIIHGTLDPELNISFWAAYGVTAEGCIHHPLGSLLEGAGAYAAVSWESSRFDCSEADGRECPQRVRDATYGQDRPMTVIYR
jgi:hypothetical protein